MAKSLSCLAWAVAFAFGRTGYGSLADVDLPMESAPAPVVSRHFPDRVHEFV